MSQPTGPWGQPPKNNKPQSPWGSPSGGSGGGGNQTPPDLDEMLKQSQEKLKNLLPGGEGFGGKSIAGLALIAAIGYGLTGFYIVKPDEVGVETVLGKFTQVKEPGLTYNFPAPFGRVEKPSVTRLNSVFIGPKSGSSSSRGEGYMLTGDENIVDITFDVQWRVSRAKPQDYIFNLSSREDSIRVVGESAMREVIGRRNINAILTTEQAAITSEVTQIMQSTLNSYGAGVEISLVQLQNVQAPTPVKDAFLDVNAAQQNQSQLQNQAREYQNKVVPEAKGQAEQMVQSSEAYREKLITESSGEALRFQKIYDEYKKSPEVTRERLFLETQGRILSGVDKVILEQGGAIPLLNLNDLTKKGASK
jgi:modulator of FtsH protease HflK